jgi:hypothetical protein
VRSYLILSMCFIFLIQYFFDQTWIKYIVVAMSLLAFIGSATKADRFPRWLGIFMMGIGVFLEYQKGTGLEGIIDGVFTILPLLCLITLAPLLSIPLRIGGYFNAVSSLLHNLVHQPKKLYVGITSTLFMLSPILSLGSVRIIHEFLEELKLPSEMSSKSYVVGFSTAVMWSPYFASVSLVLYYLNVTFKEYIAYGIGLSLLSLIIGYVLFSIWEKRHPLPIEINKIIPFEKMHRKYMIRLVVFVVGLIVTCLAIEHLTGWSMIVIVCILSILVPLTYGSLTNSWNQLRPYLVDFRDRSVPMMNNEIMLFLSAGLLGFALQGTSLANGVGIYLTDLAGQSFFLFALAVMVIVLFVTYIGVHQIAVIGALAMQLNADELGISHLALAMLLLLTWSTSTALSPFSGLNLMVSRFSGVSGIRTGLYSNGTHLTVVAIIGVVIISIIG